MVPIQRRKREGDGRRYYGSVIPIQTMEREGDGRGYYGSVVPTQRREKREMDAGIMVALSQYRGAKERERERLTRVL